MPTTQNAAKRGTSYVSLVAYVDRDTRAALQQIAAENERSMVAEVRYVLKKYVADHITTEATAA
jgi:plasmid stability protein